jgi:hypothetical protein
MSVARRMTLHVRISSVLQEGRYSTEELSTAVITSCACALVIGFIAGFLVARQAHPPTQNIL